MMKLYIVTLVFLICITALTQSLPFFADDPVSTGFDPNSLPNRALHLEATDLATGVGISSWTDRVRSKQWLQATTSKQPTNTTKGLHFYQEGAQRQWLLEADNSFTPPNQATNATHSFFVAMRTDTYNSGNFGTIVGNSGGFHQDYNLAANHPKFFIQTSIGLSEDFPATNQVYTVAVNYSFIGGVIGSTNYNNAVPFSTNNAASYSQGARWFDFLGGIDGTAVYRGYICEFIYFTNRSLTLTDIQNLHNRAVATYQ